MSLNHPPEVKLKSGSDQDPSGCYGCKINICTSPMYRFHRICCLYHLACTNQAHSLVHNCSDPTNMSSDHLSYATEEFPWFVPSGIRVFWDSCGIHVWVQPCQWVLKYDICDFLQTEGRRSHEQSDTRDIGGRKRSSIGAIVLRRCCSC